MKRKNVICLALAASLLMTNVIPVYATSISENSISEERDVDVFQYENKVKDDVRDSLVEITGQHAVEVLLYGTPSYNLKLAPSSDSADICAIPIGSQMQIIDVVITAEEDVFYLVELVHDEHSYKGYVSDAYVVTNDYDFNTWRTVELSKVVGIDIDAEGSSSVEIQANFPQAYWPALTQLVSIHPNWIFVPFNTGLEWNDVVAAERVGNRSLVYKTVSDSWKSKDAGDYNAVTGTYVPKSGANWFRASQDAVEFCLNPLNYLDEKHIFAFEQLTFNSGIHNENGVKTIIQSSWMANRALEDGSGGLYSDVFMQAGELTGVSPYHLASRVLQEQGVAGSAMLISGYGGVYNYFNVQASGSTADEILANGTAYAQSQGWTTRFLSILGGAQRLGSNYITKGQDTLYLQKFDVESSNYGLFSHQYMQNIQAPTTESNSVYNAYAGAGALDNNYVFRIPIYNNMPTNSGRPVFKISEDFIVRMYNVILDREPDLAGYADWKNWMATGTSASEVALNFFWSKEFCSKNMSDSVYLDYAYRAILGREPDAAGKEYWMRELAAGCSRNSILLGFLYSQEFSDLCKSYGVLQGNVNQKFPNVDLHSNKTKFVVRLYRNILHREPDSDGLNYWVDNLVNGQSACQLVGGFVYSNEFLNSNLSNEDYAEILYETMLGRSSDPEGKSDWVGKLNRGVSRDEVLRGFLYSQEFGDLCAKYGIEVGNL